METVFATQDHEASEGVMAAPWSERVNVGVRGHDASYLFLFRDEGMWFSRLILKLLVYMHGIVHVAYACELL